jgi:hypothetical protein
MKTAILAIGFLVLGFSATVSSEAAQAEKKTCECGGTNCAQSTDNPGIMNVMPLGSCPLKDGSYTKKDSDSTCVDSSDSKIIRYCNFAVATVASECSDVEDKEINTANRSRKYGCKYGGASAENTKTINTAVNATGEVMDKVGQMSVQNANANATNSVLSKGITATNTDISNAQAASLNSAANAAQTAAIVNSGMTGTQMMRAYQHQASIKAVQAKATEATTQSQTTLDNQKNECAKLVTPAAIETCNLTAQQTFDATKATIKSNAAAEIAEQKKLASGEAISAAVTGFKAMSNFQQASMDRAAAAATTASASNFSYNPVNGGGYSGDGTVTAPTPDAGQNLGSADNSAGNLASANQINPNPNDGLGGANQLGAFTPATAPPAGGAAPAALGNAGGTSAAKDDQANKDNTKPSATAVGSYSAGDTPTGYNRNAGNNGPSVGLDSSFADMMKKFLPGGDEEKKADGSANFDDRAPASDAATVIARNKNIFEEVHKRYEKKNTEGAIVF